MAQDFLTSVYIVRHGESENNVKDIIGADPDLTAKGKQEAKSIAKKLTDIPFAAIFSSDLIRAKKTAQIIALQRRLRVITRKELRERNYGKYEGQLMTKYQREMRDVIERMCTMTDEEIKVFRRYEGFETDEELALRFTDCLRRLIISYRGKTLLVVTHGMVMRVLLVYLGFTSYKELPPFAIENTGYVHVLSDGANFFVKEVSGVRKTS